MKWETSVGSTVEFDVGLWYFGVVVDMLRDAIGESVRRCARRADERHVTDRETWLLSEQIILVGFVGFIVGMDAHNVPLCLSTTRFDVDVTKSFGGRAQTPISR